MLDRDAKQANGKAIRRIRAGLTEPAWVLYKTDRDGRATGGGLVLVEGKDIRAAVANVIDELGVYSLQGFSSGLIRDRSRLGDGWLYIVAPLVAPGEA